MPCTGENVLVEFKNGKHSALSLLKRALEEFNNETRS